jgi:hypothetical protein
MKLFKIKIALAAIIVSALAGCAVNPAVSTHPIALGQPTILTTDASARGIIMLPRPSGTGMSVCAEPSPDAILSTVAQMVAQVKLQNPQVDAQTQVNFQTAVVELSKRSTTILFLRESLFRVCEQQINQNLSSEQVMQLYTMAMQTALKLAEADATNSQTKLAEQLKDPKVAALLKQLALPQK